MFRMAIATVALIGILPSNTPSLAADLLGAEGQYDQSYYDGPYQPAYPAPAPRAGINGRTAFLPPAYAPPGAAWSCQQPPYGTGDLRPLDQPYRWVLPPQQPSYWQPDYERPYGPPAGEWNRAYSRPQEDIYGAGPVAPDTYARPGYPPSYDLYANCGVDRYWDGRRCVDVRYAPYPAGRRL